MDRSKTYKTKQSNSVLEYLKSNTEKHFSVEDIYMALKANNQFVGKTTIYRNLDKLIEKGLVKKFVIENKKDSFFQYVNQDECNDHYHLKCQICMKLIHISNSKSKELKSYFDKIYKFKLDSQDIVLYGTCDSCRS